jgi:hypothetical protein
VLVPLDPSVYQQAEALDKEQTLMGKRQHPSRKLLHGRWAPSLSRLMTVRAPSGARTHRQEGQRGTDSCLLSLSGAQLARRREKASRESEGRKGREGRAAAMVELAVAGGAPTAGGSASQQPPS